MIFSGKHNAMSRISATFAPDYLPHGNISNVTTALSGVMFGNAFFGVVVFKPFKPFKPFKCSAVQAVHTFRE